MKKYLSIVLLSSIVCSTAQTFAATYPEATEAIQNGVVEIEIDEEGGLIVGPEEPIEPLDPSPTDPPITNPNAGLLKINYVSDLIFSDNKDDGTNKGAVKYTGDKLELYAANDTHWTTERDPFLNTEDRRVDGNAGNYQLTATMSKEGYVNGSASLKGATTDITTTTHNYAKTTTVASTYSLIPETPVTVVTATEDIGSHSFAFDQAKLTIPAGLSLAKGTYTATINWNLMGDTP